MKCENTTLYTIYWEEKKKKKYENYQEMCFGISCKRSLARKINIPHILNNRTKCGISKRFHMKSKYGLRRLLFQWLYTVREHKYFKYKFLCDHHYIIHKYSFWYVLVLLFFLFFADSLMKDNYEKWFRFYVFAWRNNNNHYIIIRDDVLRGLILFLAFLEKR